MLINKNILPRLLSLKNAFKVLSLIFTAFLIMSCSRPSSTDPKSKIALSLPPRFEKTVDSYAINASHAIVNISGPDLTTPIFWDWDACPQGCTNASMRQELPPVISFEVPAGHPYLIQALIVYEDSTTKQMDFAYGDSTGTETLSYIRISDSEVSIPITVSSIGIGTGKMLNFSGRYLDTPTEGPTGQVGVYFQPRGQKPQMKIMNSFMYAGWSEFFAIEGLEFNYILEDQGRLLLPALSYASPELAPSNNILYINTPTDMYRVEMSSGGTSYRKVNEGGGNGQNVVGFLGAGAATKKVCFENPQTPIAISGYAANSQGQALYYSGNINSSTTVNVAGGIGPCQGGTENTDYIKFYYNRIGDNNGVNFRGAFLAQISTGSNSYDGFNFFNINSNTSTNATISWNYVPGLIVDRAAIFRIDNFTSEIEQALNREKSIDCNKLFGLGFYTAGEVTGTSATIDNLLTNSTNKSEVVVCPIVGGRLLGGSDIGLRWHSMVSNQCPNNQYWDSATQSCKSNMNSNGNPYVRFEPTFNNSSPLMSDNNGNYRIKNNSCYELKASLYNVSSGTNNYSPPYFVTSGSSVLINITAGTNFPLLKFYSASNCTGGTSSSYTSYVSSGTNQSSAFWLKYNDAVTTATFQLAFTYTASNDGSTSFGNNSQLVNYYWIDPSVTSCGTNCGGGPRYLFNGGQGTIPTNYCMGFTISNPFGVATNATFSNVGVSGGTFYSDGICGSPISQGTPQFINIPTSGSFSFRTPTTGGSLSLIISDGTISHDGRLDISNLWNSTNTISCSYLNLNGYTNKYACFCNGGYTWSVISNSCEFSSSAGNCTSNQFWNGSVCNELSFTGQININFINSVGTLGLNSCTKFEVTVGSGYSAPVYLKTNTTTGTLYANPRCTTILPTPLPVNNQRDFYLLATSPSLPMLISAGTQANVSTASFIITGTASPGCILGETFYTPINGPCPSIFKLRFERYNTNSSQWNEIFYNSTLITNQCIQASIGLYENMGAGVFSISNSLTTGSLDINTSQGSFYSDANCGIYNGNSLSFPAGITAGTSRTNTFSIFEGTASSGSPAYFNLTVGSGVLSGTTTIGAGFCASSESWNGSSCISTGTVSGGSFAESGVFTGTNSYLHINTGTYYMTSTAATFTMEARIRINQLPSAGNYGFILEHYGTSGSPGNTSLFIDEYGHLFGNYKYDCASIYSVPINSTTGTGGFPVLTTGTVYHVALMKIGDYLRLNINGVEQNFAGPFATNGNGCLYSDYAVGVSPTSGTIGYFNGLIDEVRISTNPRYSSPFYSVPTAPFGDDGFTQLLLHMNQNGSASSLNGNDVARPAPVNGVQWNNVGYVSPP